MSHSHPTSRSRTVLLLALIAAVLVGLLPPGSATAKPSRPARCVALVATGTGQDLGGGRTTATISVRQRPIADTEATFAVTGIADGVATFAGTIVFTPRRLNGTLVAQVTGTLDLTSGAFTSTSTSVTGTGVLDGITGSVRIRGVEELTTGVFTETLRIRLCGPAVHGDGVIDH